MFSRICFIVLQCVCVCVCMYLTHRGLDHRHHHQLDYFQSKTTKQTRKEKKIQLCLIWFHFFRCCYFSAWITLLYSITGGHETFFFILHFSLWSLIDFSFFFLLLLCVCWSSREEKKIPIINHLFFSSSCLILISNLYVFDIDVMNEWMNE